MSSLPADLGIWALLVIGTVFCGFGLMGLLLFPDTKSRMFTAFRATAIGLGAIILAVMTYGYTMFLTVGGDEYVTLILHTLFLAFVIASGTWVMHGIIRERTLREKPGSAGQQPAVPDHGPKNGD
jgi:multisubunit Na+/H+ antiporter MnhG subunit